LKERNKLPSFEGSGFDTVVFAMNDTLYGPAVQVASTLRENGQSVDLIMENRKSKWVFKYAGRNEARYCVIVGEDEYKNGEVAVKDLESGEQRRVKLDELSDWVKEVAMPSSL
jgi:histidyl-tRNA synthetase